MEIDDPEPFSSWGSFRRRMSIGRSRRHSIAGDLENSIWKLLEWADSQRLGAKRTVHKEKAIRVWLQPLVSANKENVNLFHSDFKKKVGRISQSEVKSLLNLEQTFRRKRLPGSDDADRCQRLLAALCRHHPHAYRKLLVRWVVMEFSRKEPPPKREQFRKTIKNKKRPLQDITAKNSSWKKPNVEKDYSMNIQSDNIQTTQKLMVGNVKENKKFPPFGWIFPCVTCFQPTSNVYQRMIENQVGVGIHMCKKCYKKRGGVIPEDICDGSRSNTRVVTL